MEEQPPLKLSTQKLNSSQEKFIFVVLKFSLIFAISYNHYYITYMKHIYMLVGAMLFACTTMFAANDESQDSASPQSENTSSNNKVWKRGKYIYFSYGNQNLKNSLYKLESDFSVSLTTGKTFYLHRKPIAGFMKFGLDVSFLDMNFAKYPDLPYNTSTSAGSDQIDLNVMQAEIGIGVGPSLTFNPVNHLKAALYFHVTPTASGIYQNEELYYNYATFFNAGLTLSYKLISVGVERRWSTNVDYDGVTMNRISNSIYDSDGTFHDPFQSVGSKLQTNTFRIFIGLRW